MMDPGRNNQTKKGMTLHDLNILSFHVIFDYRFEKCSQATHDNDICDQF